MKKRILSYIYAEAEYILDTHNRYRKYFRPSWDPYVPRKYDVKDEDSFRIKNIWTHIVLSFWGLLSYLGIITLVIWYPPTRSTLFTFEFYLGVSISVFLAIAYLTVHQRLRQHLIRTSASQADGERRFRRIGTTIITTILIVLAISQVIWSPFAMFILYFTSVNNSIGLVVLVIYLMMRQKNKDYVPPTFMNQLL